MTARSDPAVRLETLAAAAGMALNTLRRLRVAGKIPQADAVIGGKRPPARAWKLSTIRAWNPHVADRCAAILTALENVPPKAA